MGPVYEALRSRGHVSAIAKGVRSRMVRMASPRRPLLHTHGIVVLAKFASHVSVSLLVKVKMVSYVRRLDIK